MKPLEKIIERVRQRQCRIVLSEGDDRRIVAGTIRADAEGIARITLLGDEVRMAGVIAERGGDPRRFRIEDPARSGLAAGYAEIFHEMRGCLVNTPYPAQLTGRGRRYQTPPSGLHNRFGRKATSRTVV